MEKFVVDGGCLVTTPDFGTQDEWGRPLANPFKGGIRFSKDRIVYGPDENNVAFAYRLFPEAREVIKKAVAAHSKMPYSVVGLPFGVEVAVQKNSEGKILIHTLDYIGNRDVEGARIRDNATGKETLIPKFHIHGMTVL